MGFAPQTVTRRCERERRESGSQFERQDHNKQKTPEEQRKMPPNPNTKTGSTLTISTTISEGSVELGKGDSHGPPAELQPPPPEKTLWRKLSGMAFAVGAAALYALVNVFGKSLQKNYHPFNITFWCFFGYVVPSIPLIFIMRVVRKQRLFDNVWPTVRANWWNLGLLAGIGIVNTSIVHLRFSAVGFLTVADCTVIMNCGTIFTLVLAHFILKERCGVVPMITSVWILFGVAVLARPPFLTGSEEFDLDIIIGAAIAIGAVIAIAILSILLRKMRQVHFLITMLVCGLWGLAQGGAVAAAFGVLVVPQGQEDILHICALALFIFLANISLVMALKFEEAGIVSLIRSSDVIFAFIFQLVILGTHADLISYVGAIIVLSGVILIAFRKWLGLQDKGTRLRRWFGWLLA